MDKIQNKLSDYQKKDYDLALKRAYEEAKKNPNFVKLLNKLKLKDSIAYRYTSKLERTMIELDNCENCRSIMECKNKVPGYVYYPTMVDDKLEFNYVACPYQKELLKNEKSFVTYYEMPMLIKQARMKDIDVSDKKRALIIKWLKDFYDHYGNNKNLKGLYLHGSFGSGKTFLIASLLNELALQGTKVVIVYFPDFILSLKNFNDDYVDRINELKKAPILFLDDMGAQPITEWSRDEVLGSIVQYRMDSNLPTFFTSNYNIEELEAKLSSSKGKEEKIAARRIIERIKQLTDQIEMVSVNRRK